jgi:hypothetical protein
MPNTGRSDPTRNRNQIDNQKRLDISRNVSGRQRSRMELAQRVPSSSADGGLLP